MAAEDVCTTAGHADVAQGELQQAGGADHGMANGVLGLTHAPDDGAGPVHGHGFGGLKHFGLWHARDLCDASWGPLLHDLFANSIHAVDTVVDVLLVFPTVLENVVQHAEQEGDIGTRPKSDILVCLGRSAGKAWVDDDDLAAVLFFCCEQVKHGNGVGLRRIRADVHRCL